MRFWPALLVPFVIAGCSSQQLPESNTAPAAATTPTASAAPTPTQEATPAPTGTNPSRVHQLSTLKTTLVKAAGHEIKAWVMDNESTRQEGMMFLTDGEVKSDEGMLFVFPDVQKKADHGFWMHNTILPLDIIYISVERKILNVGKGKAMDDTNVLPSGDYRYVLELKQGTAAKLGLKPGDALSFADLSSN